MRVGVLLEMMPEICRRTLTPTKERFAPYPYYTSSSYYWDRYFSFFRTVHELQLKYEQPLHPKITLHKPDKPDIMKLDDMYCNSVPILFIEYHFGFIKQQSWGSGSIARYIMAQFVYDFIEHNNSSYKNNPGIKQTNWDSIKICYDSEEWLLELKERFIELCKEIKPNIKSLLVDTINTNRPIGDRCQEPIKDAKEYIRISLSAQEWIMKEIHKDKYIYICVPAGSDFKDKYNWHELGLNSLTFVGSSLALFLDMILVERIMQKYKIGVYDYRDEIKTE